MGGFVPIRRSWPSKAARLAELILLVCVLALPAWPSGYGEAPGELPIPGAQPFVGIASNYDARIIPDIFVQGAQNVWFDEDLGVVKRKGSSQYGSIGTSLAVRNLTNWINTSGTSNLFAVSGTSISYTTNGTFSVVMSSWSTADTSVATAHDSIWFTNATNALWYCNTTNCTNASGAATGRYVAPYRNRLWLSGITGARSRLDGSEHLDGTNWTVSTAATDPVQIIIGANDGYPVNCLFGNFNDALFIGKERGIWFLGGTDRTDFQVNNLDPEVGCLSNRTVAAAQGRLFWLSQRGIEKMEGYAIERISDPVQDLVDTIILAGGASKFWTQSSQDDWEDGNVNGDGGVGAFVPD